MCFQIFQSFSHRLFKIINKMLSTSSVLLINFSLIGFCFAAKYQTPRPHQPYKPVVYPKNYCEKISNDEEFDYVVIGSGPAGSTIARRLAENPSHKVLLMEAGEDPAPETDIPLNVFTFAGVPIWNIVPETNPNTCQAYINNSCLFTTAKVLGGNSIINIMIYIRGNKHDYNEWASATGYPGWAYKNMLPYFKKLENYLSKRPYDEFYHSKSGPFTTADYPKDPRTNEISKAFKKAVKDVGLPMNPDVNGKSQIGFGDVTAMIEKSGYRNSIVKSYLLNIPDNLKVCKKSLVKRLVISKEKQVTAVEFIYNGKENKTVKVAKEAIVCGGPVNSPQILERSGVGRKDVLQKAKVKLVQELKGVGENLQEQYANFGCAFTLDIGTSVATNPLNLPNDGYVGFLNMSDYEQPVPDLQFGFNFAEGPQAYNGKPEYSKQFVEARKNKTFFVLSSWLLRQTNPGYVHIVSDNPEARPKLNLNQYSTDGELRLQAQGCRLARKIMSSEKLKKYNVKPFIFKQCSKHKFNSDEELICAVKLLPFPLYHFGGTARMGKKSDEMSVVDDRARVHGVRNLRVGDLAIIPKIPRGNTEIPTIAVAERIADLIKEDAKKMEVPT